jgi:predicted flap endonuclease-1-like 5' DNA nuclease
MYIVGWAVLLIFLAMSLIAWLAMVWNKSKTKDTLAEYHLDHPEPDQDEDAHGDDLQVIEGIGPKISSTFQAAGISTYEELANTSVSRLEEILDEANLHLGNPSTWPDQAKLAAAGDWDALELLQDELKHGKRE